MTIFDTYLFIGTHHSGEMMILGNRDGRIIKTVNLSDVLGVSSSLAISTAKIYPPIQVSSKIYCRYRYSINDKEFKSGVLSLAIGDFTLFFSKEYGDLFSGMGLSQNLLLMAISHGFSQDNGVENLIQIGPFGTLTEMKLSDGIDDPYFDKDTGVL
ncbi:MAG: hypothetical protein R2883_01065 [Caldisericia bacterium]